jgi:ABC-type multidrug transport system fused ATPase/permease subunit
VAALASAGYGISPVLLSWVLGRVTEQVVLPAFRDGRTGVAVLVSAAGAIIGAALLRTLGGVVRRLAAGGMQHRLQGRYRSGVVHRYLQLPLSWHQRHPTGDLLSRVSADVEASWAPVAPLPAALGVVILLITAAVAAVAADPVLAMLGFGLFPVVATFNIFYQRRITPLVTLAQHRRARVSSVAHESFEGALLSKAFGREGYETRRFAEHADGLRDANTAVGSMRALFDSVLDALPGLGVLAVLAAGTYRVSSGDLTAGEAVQLTYLFVMLGVPIRAFGWVLAEVPRSVAGWDRVSAVLQAGLDRPPGDLPLPGAGPLGLVLRDVHVGYDGTDVLRGVDLDVAPGKTTALVGPTGAGKSTLVGVLTGTFVPSSGAYFLDGVDRRRLPPEALSRAIAVVPQHTLLFADTVRNNVTLGFDADDETIWQALRLAQVDAVVRALPQGLDTDVGERGGTLSGGERQRLALARALVRRPRLLVLDDTTSSVDADVEAHMVAGLRAADLPCTTVIVAYRTATLAMVDEVVYLHRGRVVDRGGHADLLARNAGYHQLVTAYAQASTLVRAEESGSLLSAPETDR